MPTTSNFGWTTPADTDLVKDGAAAIRTLGNGIDTSLVDLKGGTTGQILSKASNTDLDYTWITNDVGDITNVGVTSPITGGGSSGSVTIGIEDGTTAQKGAVQLENSTSSTSTTTAAVPASVKSAYDLADGAIPKSLVDAKGDLIVGTADNTVARLASSASNGNVLTVDTSTASGLKWAAPAAGGASYSGCSVYKSANQSVANATSTAITFNTEDFDTDAYHSTVTNTSRFTVPSGKAGKFSVTGTVVFSANATGIRNAILYKNGSVYNYATSLDAVNSGTFGTYLPLSFVLNLAVNDYVEIFAYQNSTTSLDIIAGIDATNVQFNFLGA